MCQPGDTDIWAKHPSYPQNIAVWRLLSCAWTQKVDAEDQSA
jgi:hypothetical protein